MLMSALDIKFSLKRPKSDMGKAAEYCYKAFSTVAEKIDSRDLIQEFLPYKILKEVKLLQGFQYCCREAIEGGEIQGR